MEREAPVVTLLLRAKRQTAVARTPGGEGLVGKGADVGFFSEFAGFPAFQAPGVSRRTGRCGHHPVFGLCVSSGLEGTVAVVRQCHETCRTIQGGKRTLKLSALPNPRRGSIRPQAERLPLHVGRGLPPSQFFRRLPIFRSRFRYADDL